MAHAAFHFTAGLAVGMLLQAPPLRQAWERSREVAPAVLRWMAWSWGCGLWATLPSLIRFAGVPESFCSGWWMNLFLLHPLINRWGPHATIIGGVVFVCGFAFQYAVLLAAIGRIRRIRRIS